MIINEIILCVGQKSAALAVAMLFLIFVDVVSSDTVDVVDLLRRVTRYDCHAVNLHNFPQVCSPVLFDSERNQHSEMVQV